MASTTFVDNSSIIYASWLNDVNSAVYNGTFISSTISPTNIVCNGSVSGTGFSGLVNNTLTAPGAIGNGTPNTGAFTTLSATTLSLTNALGRAYGGTGLTTAGTAGNVLTSDGTNWTSSSKITSMTVQASTSGTFIDFTGIPSWVKRITVMFNGVSTSNVSNWLIQIGSGSVTTTGYAGAGSVVGAASCITTAFTTGFGIRNASATTVLSGAYVLTLVTGNTWVINGNLGEVASPATYTTGGVLALSGALDRVRITTVSGTDTFDAGSINVLYE